MKGVFPYSHTSTHNKHKIPIQFFFQKFFFHLTVALGTTVSFGTCIEFFSRKYKIPDLNI